MNHDLPIGYIAANGIALSPDDSLGRAVELLQLSTSGAVPVMEGSTLCGLVSDKEVARGLSLGEDTPVSAVMEKSVPLAPATMPAREGLRLLAETDFPALPVVLPDGYFVGTVGRAELLAALYRRRRPPMVGGMATPLGVYLSDGTFQGGAGSLGLVLTGVFLALGSVVATLLGMGAEYAWRRTGLNGAVPAAWVSTAVFIVGFALWFRLSWVAGYHAAEHQTVHAIERNEPLTVERVSTMPRPHPRCGTNIAILFALFITLVYSLHWDAFTAGVLSLIAYRFFGYWVQLHITTRPATKKQLENGIHAGEQLLERYQNGVPPARFRGFRRIWNMGLLQVAAGYMASFAVLAAVSRFLPFVGRLLASLQ